MIADLNKRLTIRINPVFLIIIKIHLCRNGEQPLPTKGCSLIKYVYILGRCPQRNSCLFFKTEGFDGIQACCFFSRIIAEENPIAAETSRQ